MSMTMPLFTKGKPTWQLDSCLVCTQEVETMAPETEPHDGRRVVRLAPCGHLITVGDPVVVTFS